MNNFIKSLSNLQSDTIDRYMKRYEMHGVSSFSLGWGGESYQNIRYQTVCESFDLEGKSILDFGCGFGDFLYFLKRKKINCNYLGIDVNQKFIKKAKKLHPNNQFEVYDISKPIPKHWKSDVVIMLGVLNYKQTKINNKKYTNWMLNLTYKLARNALICDFLSSVFEKNYVVEDWVNYYKPQDILKLALTITEKVTLKHNYPSIPQREMLIVMEH